MSPINVLFRVKVKAGREDEFCKLTVEMVRTTRAEDEGCRTFNYHQHTSGPSDFFLYEQWRAQDAMQAHLDRLLEVYGPPQEGKFLPASPTSFRDDIQVGMYDVVE